MFFLHCEKEITASQVAIKFKAYSELLSLGNFLIEAEKTEIA